MILNGYIRNILQTHELLDRLEIIYPKSAFIIDLRKAIVSDDQNALFRIIQSKKTDNIIESIRKYIHNPEFDIDSISRGQLQSKIWLIKHLKEFKKNLGTVFLCAGWYGILATMLFEDNDFHIEKIRSFDIDKSSTNIAENFNRRYLIDSWKFKASTLDINSMQYPTRHVTYRKDGSCMELIDDPDTIINTSCEHIENFETWYSNIPAEKILVLQNNNYFDLPEHVNCKKNLLEFAASAPLTDVFYEGQLSLNKYTRFMRIGIK